MSREFSAAEKIMLGEVASNVEEFHYEMRKQITQNKYAFEVKAGCTWYNWITETADDPVPEEFVGFWVMEHARCLAHSPFGECIREDEWVKCNKEEVITYEYVPVE